MEGGAGSARVAEVEKEGAGRELCSPMAAVAVKVVSLCWWTASLASSRPGMLVERGGVEVGSARRRRSRRARAGGVREKAQRGVRAKARSDWPSLSPDRAHAWTAGSCGYGGRRTRRRAAVGRRAAELQPVQRAAMAYLRAQAPPCSAEQLDAERWESEAEPGEGGGARQTDEACPLLTSPLLRPAMPARLCAGPHELPPLAARASDAAATLRRLLAAPTPRR